MNLIDKSSKKSSLEKSRRDLKNQSSLSLKECGVVGESPIIAMGGFDPVNSYNTPKEPQRPNNNFSCNDKVHWGFMVF